MIEIMNNGKVRVSVSNQCYDGTPFTGSEAGMFLLMVSDRDDPYENCHASLISQADLLELVDGLNKCVEDLTTAK